MNENLPKIEPDSPSSLKKSDSLQRNPADSPRISRAPTIVRKYCSEVVAKSIEKVRVPHEELDTNVDNVDNLIGAAAERNSLAFALELKPKVDEKLRKLEALRKKAKDQERGHALRSVIEQLNQKQGEYKLMEKSLRKKVETLEEEYKKETEKYSEIKSSVRSKKDILKTIHKENMALYQKELLLKQQLQQKQSKNFFITGKDFDIKEPSTRLVHSQYAEEMMKYPSCEDSKMSAEEREKIRVLREKYDYLLKVSNQLKEVKSQTIGHYYMRMNEINELGEFFKLCIEAGKKQLFKEQELIKAAQKGQGGTLLYELKRKKQETNDLAKTAKVDYMQDRHMKTVIYEVIKRIISNAKQQKKFEHIASIKLDWESFKTMRSLDVLALLLLRRDILDQLFNNLFSHALYHIHEPKSS